MSEKEVLFYECDCCGHKGANPNHICSYCNTLLDIDKIRKYTYQLELKLNLEIEKNLISNKKKRN